MTTDLATQARELRASLDAKQQDAAAAWKNFADLRDSAKTEGVDFTKNAEAFDKLDAAGKAYDAIRDEIAAGESKWQRLASLSREDAPSSPVDERKAAELAERREEIVGAIGKRFVESDVYANLKRLAQSSGSAIGNSEGVKVASLAETKTLLTTAAGGAALFRNDRLPNVVMTPQPIFNLLDVLTVGETDSDTIEWVEETTYTNSAAETAEGSAAPESAVAYTVRSSLVQEIVNSLPATKKMLADAPLLASMLDARLVNGLRNRAQGQVINGNGTTPNLRGIVNVAGILTQARGADSRSDAIHKAITKIRIQAEDQAAPQYVGIHPTDWETVQLEKDTTGAYLFGGPAGSQGGTVWGLRPIVSTQFTAGTALVMDTEQLIFAIREGISVSASDSHANFFTERKVMMLASMRAALGVFQPKAFCTVTSM